MIDELWRDACLSGEERAGGWGSSWFSSASLLSGGSRGRGGGRKRSGISRVAGFQSSTGLREVDGRSLEVVEAGAFISEEAEWFSGGMGNDFVGHEIERNETTEIGERLAGETVDGACWGHGLAVGDDGAGVLFKDFAG